MANKMPKGEALQGKHVVVTRAAHQGTEFETQLKAAGAFVTQMPLLTFERTELTEMEKEAVSHFQTFDWLVFTSSNGVRFFMDALSSFGIESEPTSWPQIAVVGEKTAATLREYQLQEKLVPKEYVAERFLEELQELVNSEDSVLLIRGKLGRRLIAEQLSQLVQKLTEVTVYDTVFPAEAQEQFKHLCDQHIDLFTFTSSSTVHHFVQLLQEFKLDWQEYPWNFACIGPIAAKTCRHYGLPVVIMPDTYTIEALSNAIIAYYEEEKSNE
ncbi:uroporphyrinogen-III synthase [Alkalihalobacillus pseudalcaliphilus]|uniref:uroporphyrinogen-III synthase n=1 Tax=Alkalihalobacillus pseudalcaliphilus TaxID=79884 RepID=UPI0023619FD8|nr:uroporphyrinogen-III synthase [Alkalihalobacillus pseudalcaliphilus]